MGALAALLLSLGSSALASSVAGSGSAGCKDRRPPVSLRTFSSPAVEAAIEDIARQMMDQELACIFRNAFPNCLDTTIYSFKQAADKNLHGECGLHPGTCDIGNAIPDRDDTFVVTGDIKAMWLRDSTNQVLPYLRYAKADPKLQAMLRGVLHRQTQQVLFDAYANAFNFDRVTNANPWGQQDQTFKTTYLNTRVNALDPLIFERKYELDSLCAFLKLSVSYLEATNDVSPYDQHWVDAVSIVLSTMRSQQKATGDDDGEYTFQRCTSCEPTDTLSHGTGFPAAYTGLIRSAFRPSDDSCQYSFLVPANAMAVVELRRVAALLVELELNATLSTELRELAEEVDRALQEAAVVRHQRSDQKVFAYEVDGYGNSYHMDDANVPSLLSLPYLGYTSSSDTTYQATRRLVLDNSTNPYFFVGDAAEGVGSPHTGFGKIWHMSIIMRALTSDSNDEILECLRLLKETTGSQWVMHESFDRDNADQYTRSWFSWANALFGELIIRLSETKRDLIFGAVQAV